MYRNAQKRMRLRAQAGILAREPAAILGRLTPSLARLLLLGIVAFCVSATVTAVLLTPARALVTGQSIGPLPPHVPAYFAVPAFNLQPITRIATPWTLRPGAR
jgi:hypothetical protein